MGVFKLEEGVTPGFPTEWGYFLLEESIVVLVVLPSSRYVATEEDVLLKGVLSSVLKSEDAWDVLALSTSLGGKEGSHIAILSSLGYC